MSHWENSSYYPRLAIMDSCVFTLMQSAGIPEAIHNNVIDFAKPDKLDGDLKKELELMGTFMIFKKLSLECDKEWELYYKAWNSRQRPGLWLRVKMTQILHIWSISSGTVKGDKSAAFPGKSCNYPRLGLFAGKVSNYERVVWEYQACLLGNMSGPSSNIRPLSKKISSVTLTVCRPSSKVKRLRLTMAGPCNSEREQWALQQEEEDYLNSLPYDPYDDYY